MELEVKEDVGEMWTGSPQFAENSVKISKVHWHSIVVVCIDLTVNQTQGPPSSFTEHGTILLQYEICQLVDRVDNFHL